MQRPRRRDSLSLNPYCFSTARESLLSSACSCSSEAAHQFRQKKKKRKKRKARTNKEVALERRREPGGGDDGPAQRDCTKKFDSPVDLV